ncbi:hypothetical protein Tco_1504474, partial [Tanacetum coccineum]
EHVVEPVSKHLDFIPSGATRLTKYGGEACYLDKQNPRCCLEGWEILVSKMWWMINQSLGRGATKVGVGDSLGDDDEEVARNVKKNGVEDDDYMVEVNSKNDGTSFSSDDEDEEEDEG